MFVQKILKKVTWALQRYCNFYSARSFSFAEYRKDFKARFDGLHAAGYNSTESEPIWVKFGML